MQGGRYRYVAGRIPFSTAKTREPEGGRATLPRAQQSKALMDSELDSRVSLPQRHIHVSTSLAASLAFPPCLNRAPWSAPVGFQPYEERTLHATWDHTHVFADQKAPGRRNSRTRASLPALVHGREGLRPSPPRTSFPTIRIPHISPCPSPPSFSSPGPQDVPILTADAHDAPSVRRVVGQGEVVLAVAGPFARHGDNVVAASVEEGTHYADITGGGAWREGPPRCFHGERNRGVARRGGPMMPGGGIRAPRAGQACVREEQMRLGAGGVFARGAAIWAEGCLESNGAFETECLGNVRLDTGQLGGVWNGLGRGLGYDNAAGVL